MTVAVVARQRSGISVALQADGTRELGVQLTQRFFTMRNSSRGSSHSLIMWFLPCVCAAELYAIDLWSTSKGIFVVMRGILIGFLVGSGRKEKAKCYFFLTEMLCQSIAQLISSKMLNLCHSVLFYLFHSPLYYLVSNSHTLFFPFTITRLIEPKLMHHGDLNSDMHCQPVLVFKKIIIL